MSRNCFLPLLVSIFLSSSCYKAEPNKNSEAAYFGYALDGNPITQESMANIFAKTNQKADFLVFFLQWPKSPFNNNFPKESLLNILKQNAIPVLSWEPMFIDDEQERTISAESILAGNYDKYITNFAQEARQLKQPLVIRFAHEMNLKRYHWGTSINEYGSKNPDLYKKMFQRVVKIFRKEKADLVLWAFCPNSESVPSPQQEEAKWNTISNYFPGRNFVDLLGLDGYNWGNSRTLEKDGWTSKERSFDEIFQKGINELRSLAPQKPLIIFETASIGNFKEKKIWLLNSWASVQKYKLQALIWFDVNKENDWRVPAQLNLIPNPVKKPSSKEWALNLARERLEREKQ